MGQTQSQSAQRELQLFWQALSTAVYDNTAGAECVTLSNSHRWFDEHKFGSILLERECYRTLWNIIDAGWHSDTRSDYLVVGTSGIGKTSFLFYVMWKLITKTNADGTLAILDLRIIVEMRRKETKPNVRYYFRRASGWFGSTFTVEVGGPDSFMAQLKDLDVYYLCDETHPLSELGGRKAHTQETASLDEQLFSSYENEGGTIKLIMPIWKYSELTVARAKVFSAVTVAKLKTNYALMGGTIRWVLKKQHFDATLDLKVQVATATSKCDISNTLKSNGHARTETGVSDILVHYIVEDETTCRKAVYDFASGYIIRQLQKSHTDELTTYFEDIIQHSKGSRGGLYFGSLAGRFFEDYAIRTLCEGGSFQVKKISPASRDAAAATLQITFPALSYRDSVEDIVDEQADMQRLGVNQIGVPTNPCFPSIDAVHKAGTVVGINNDMFFQMKNVNSMSSGIKKMELVHLNCLRGHMANLPVRLFQAVPDLNYANATPFTYYNADGTVGVRPAHVEEWLLSIPTVGLSQSARKKRKVHH